MMAKITLSDKACIVNVTIMIYICTRIIKENWKGIEHYSRGEFWVHKLCQCAHAHAYQPVRHSFRHCFFIKHKARSKL